MAEPFDVDALPPTQYLVMEVLAARARTGEPYWTFPSNLAIPLRALEGHGLVIVMHGVTQGTIRARLTETGRSAVLSPDYVPPNPVLPEGTTTEERWSVRWTWPTGESDDMECNRARGSMDPLTPRERATVHARRHTGNGITGEVLRRYVHTTPDEVVERYEPEQATPDTAT